MTPLSKQGYTRHLSNAASMLASVPVVGPTLIQYRVNASCLLVGLHHISTDLKKYDAVFLPVQKTQGSTSSCICIPGSESMQIQGYRYSHVIIICLYNILPTFSVYLKSATSSSWRIFFFARDKANTYTRHSTYAVSMLGQRRCRWPIIEKLTAPTIFIVFVGYIASGAGYPGGVGDEILLH